MKSRIIQRWAILLSTFFAFGLFAGTVPAAEFLDPEQAFRLKSELRDSKTLVMTWTIAPGYHLYRERLQFTVDKAEVKLGAPLLPAGIRKFDTNFNKEVETYQERLTVELPIAQAHEAFTLNVGYQGCADAGLCYAPAAQDFTVDPARPGTLTVLQTASATVQSASPQPLTAEDDSSLAQRTLQSGSLVRIGMAFLVFGLLLSFTPCVLPMVPILSSIIVGEGSVSRSRGFLLALAYCFGMALIYTALGVAAGLAGEGLAAALQKPWVLATFALLLVTLSLSMFDVYQLQLPGVLQSRLSETSGRLRGGRFIGVFVMGALSALIVGPCVAGPLAGALLYISQTRNGWLGGWALFAMAVGMSVPLLLTGISAGSLLPRAGAWMNEIKRIFGLLLIAVALWMVSPIVPTPVAMAMWGSFAILCAVFLRVFEPAQAKIGQHFSQALGVVFLLVGLFELIGAASAGTDVLQPLKHLRTAQIGTLATQHESGFTRIRNIAELERHLQSANTPVVLDFYADWCVACKEMERFTFSDTKVGEHLKQFRLLQVDVTANSDEDRALMKKYGLFGPPGMILFNSAGQEVPQSRVIGYMAPDPFLKHLQRHLPM